MTFDHDDLDTATRWEVWEVQDDRIEEHRDLVAGLEYEDWSKARQLHRHHRQLRRHGNEEPENIMYVPLEQHDWIHRNVGLAYELGWLVHSWEDPAEVPIRGEWPLSMRTALLLAPGAA